MQAPCQIGNRRLCGFKSLSTGVSAVIDINPVNVLTIGLIAVLAYAAVRFGAKAIGFEPSWL